MGLYPGIQSSVTCIDWLVGGLILGELIFRQRGTRLSPGAFMERIHDINFICQYYLILIMNRKLRRTSRPKETLTNFVNLVQTFLYKIKWRLRCYRGRTCFVNGFIVWMLGVLTTIKPNGKQRHNSHVHVFTPLEHPHLSQTWLDQHTTRAPLRSLFKGGEYQGAHEQKGYDPRAAPVVRTVGVAVWCESIAYHIQDVICYGNVHSSLNKKVQPADELNGSSISV